MLAHVLAKYLSECPNEDVFVNGKSVGAVGLEEVESSDGFEIKLHLGYIDNNTGENECCKVEFFTYDCDNDCSVLESDINLIRSETFKTFSALKISQEKIILSAIIDDLKVKLAKLEDGIL